MNVIKILTAMLLLQGHLFGAAWLTDFSAAQAKAKAGNKLLLLDFTGSDWCGWCIRLKNEVFNQPDFEAFASENLVLVEVDFPHYKTQPAELRAANQLLASRYGITGYPTIVLLDSDGAKVGITGYRPGGAKAYVTELQKLAGAKMPKHSPGNIGIGQQPDPVRSPVPLFSGAPLGPPPVYNDLILKSVSGSNGRRFALINNKTLAEGETGLVKLGTSQVTVQCVEIGVDSVVVLVDGSAKKTLRLNSRL